MRAMIFEIIGIIMIILSIFVIVKEHAEFLLVILIAGGVGYALGSIVSDGWAIFGAILGVLIGWSAIKDRLRLID